MYAVIVSMIVKAVKLDEVFILRIIIKELKITDCVGLLSRHFTKPRSK